MQILRQGVVAVVRHDQRFLVIERAAEIRAPGAFCFPGGGIEQGESEPQALIREMQEELGVDVIPQECLWRNVTDWGVGLAWWRATIATPYEFRPDPSEVASVHWLTSPELLDLEKLLASNRAFLHAWANGEFQLT